MKVKKRFYYLILVLILLMNTVIVYADNEIDKIQKELERSNDALRKLASEKSNKTKEYKDVTNEIDKLDKQLNEIDNELKEFEDYLKIMNENIDTTEMEIVQAEENIEDKNEMMNKRLRVMYKNGVVSYLEVLLSSEDLSDFLTRLDLIQRIIDNDVDLLKYMKEQKVIIEEKKEELERQKEAMLDAKQNVEKKKNEVALVSRAKENYMNNLKTNIKQLEAQEDDLLNLADKLKAEMKKLQTKKEYTGGEMTWPAPKYYRITSPFGMRIHPIFKTKKMHTGIDIGVPLGGTIVAANDGVVQYAGWLGGYGQVVWLDHGGGIATLYAHNSRLLVEKGQTVTRGQAISKAGSTGNSTGPHLHFEVRKNGQYVDPLPWVKGK